MDRHGELGQPWEVAPRYVFVWEGLLARLPEGKEAAERRWLKLKRWERAFRLWEWDPIMRNVISDSFYRRHIVVDVLITHELPFRDLVMQYMEQSFYEITRVLHRPSLAEFEKQLPHMPEVDLVLHGEADRPFLFGSKGRLVRSSGDALLG